MTPIELSPVAAAECHLNVNVADKDEITVVVVVEANLLENKVDWLLDTGATRHFCSNKDLFQEFHEVADCEHVFMVNSATAGVHGKGNLSSNLYLEKH